MHPVSQSIKTLIDNTPSYSLDILIQDLGLIKDTLLTPKEVRKRLGISIATLNRRIKDEVLTPQKLPKSTHNRFKESEVMALITGQ